MPIRLTQEAGRAERATDDHQRTIERLVATAGRRGYAIARDLLGNAAEAEEAVQEALARACESIHTVRDQGAVNGWFYRIITNHCLRVLRRRRVRRALFGRQDSAPADELPPGAETELSRRREIAALLRALDLVPAKQRAALVLRYGHEMSVGEVATTLGVRPATAKTHLVRGLQRLRRALEETQ